MWPEFCARGRSNSRIHASHSGHYIYKPTIHLYSLNLNESICNHLKKRSNLTFKPFLLLQVHTLDRVFQCPQCEKGFKELRTLRLHLKIHNAEYPEQCSVCQKVFRTKWQLKQHQMDHGGERPYPCPECSFTCKTKQQLNEHRRKHSVST